MAKVTVIPSKINPVTHMPTVGLTKRKVAAYARVSTLQEEQSSSYDAQVDYYTKLIKSKPEWEFVDIYTDEGISGTNTKKRDGFNRMIADALKGKIDFIITKSVSRFARNTVDSLVTIRELKAKGIEVFFEEQNIYTLDSKGELLLTIMASIAQEESRSISENVKWGKRKKLADGQVSLAYSQFLGYDKHPTDRLKGLIINEAEAEIVRTIYKLFLKGKTLTAIKEELESEGYRTPKGKTEWDLSTIKSILTNEKYKGDALLQKTYVKDFLEHKNIVNNGEVTQYYVENHHDPIVNPHDWELVQIEIKRRKNLMSKFSAKSVFASRVICEDCGCFYGQKVWHSNDKYRRVVYRCNSKFDKSHQKCQTPTLDEQTLKEAFVKAYNSFLNNKDQVVEDCIEMIKILDNTATLESEIKGIREEIEVIVELVNKLVSENATKAMPQEEFLKKYNDYDLKYKALADKLNSKEDEHKKRLVQAKSMRAFIEALKQKAGTITEWDEDLMIYFIDEIRASRNKVLTFRFKNGTDIAINLE